MLIYADLRIPFLGTVIYYFHQQEWFLLTADWVFTLMTIKDGEIIPIKQEPDQHGE